MSYSERKVSHETSENRKRALADYWDHRLHNWAMYYFGGSKFEHARRDPDMPRDPNPYEGWDDEPSVVLIGEAIDTMQLVHKLPPVLQQAVQAWYWWSGTREFIARQLGIHRVTLWERIRYSKDRLSDLQFQARRDYLKRETCALATNDVQT